MPIIKLPNNIGSVVTTGTQEEADKTKSILDARYAFSQRYCKEQGWSTDVADLSLEQILQIRSQEGWKNPII